MSIKRFCDRCETEMTLRNYASKRYRPVLDKFKLEVMVTIDGAPNTGDICFTCLFDVFNNGAEDLDTE